MFKMVPRPKWGTRSATSFGTRISFELSTVKCWKTGSQIALLGSSVEIKPVCDPSNSVVGKGVSGPTNNISITSAEIIFLKVTRNMLLCSLQRRVDVQQSVLLAGLF
jgi:hypothetical protein